MKKIAVLLFFLIIQQSMYHLYAQDSDMDGWTIQMGDCDDQNPKIFPGAIELCNQIDDNCNGKVDELDVLCKSNVTLNLNANGIGILNYKDVLLSASDCGALKLYLARTTFDCYDIPNRIAVLTVSDSLHNMDTCQSIISIRDITSPAISCLSQIEVELDAKGIYKLTEPEKFLNQYRDNCFLDIRKASAGRNLFDCDDFPSRNVQIRLTDEEGNQSSCTTTVYFKDKIAPQIQCHETVKLDVMPAVRKINFTDYSEMVFLTSLRDNCGIIKVSYEPEEIILQNQRSTKFHLTVSAEDNHGNLSNCSLEVLIQKQIKSVPNGKMKLKEE